MSRDTKLLQALLDGQAAIRADLKKMHTKVDENGKKIDMLTQSLRYLENDTPTVGKLEKRVFVS